jgi:hypothetical protein
VGRVRPGRDVGFPAAENLRRQVTGLDDGKGHGSLTSGDRLIVRFHLAWDTENFGDRPK